MKTIVIFNFFGTIVAKAKVDFGRWEISNGYFKVYDFDGRLEFSYKFTDDNSWRAE